MRRITRVDTVTIAKASGGGSTGGGSTGGGSTGGGSTGGGSTGDGSTGGGSTGGGSTEGTTNSFIDVTSRDYYYDAVLWAVENGVTNGTSATTFSPDADVTRAQMVTFLWRAAGSPEPQSSVNPFTDVSSSAYYYDAVLWAVENGITNGTSATTFGPESAVSRAQAVTFLWRSASSPVVSGGSFADVADDAYYAQAVAWAAQEGITSGTGGNNFSPDQIVSRAQAVTFLYRHMG